MRPAILSKKLVMENKYWKLRNKETFLKGFWLNLYPHCPLSLCVYTFYGSFLYFWKHL